MRAQELANDLAHQLELVEAERDGAVRERDEAQAVVDAVRQIRKDLAAWEQAAQTMAADAAAIAIGPYEEGRWRGKQDAYYKARRSLDGIDGL